MKKEKYSIIITLLCLCMAMGGCSKEEVAADTATGTLTLQLQLPPALTVEVGESKGRAVSLADQIKNVWAVQYSEDGTFKKAQYISGANNIVKHDNSDYLVKVTTSGFYNENSRFYILVNTGNNSLITDQSITEENLKKLTVDLTGGISKDAEPNFLTAGPVAFKQLGEEGVNGEGVKAVITAPLSRTYAALQFSYNSNNPEEGKFEAASLSLFNLPTKLTVHTDGNSSITDFNSTGQEIKGATWNGGLLNPVYIGENLRGFGSGKTFQEKNLPAKGPNKSLDKCTYAVLTGTYYYCTGVDASNSYTYTYTTNGITVSYKFYLGGSLLDDYNIIRNTLYTVTINIGGANSADIRLTVTNGNVSYFDEVEEVQPEYEVIL